MRRAKFVPGSVFLVPSAKRHYVGIVIDDVKSVGAIYCGFLGLGEVEGCDFFDSHSVAACNSIAKAFVTRELLSSGAWKLCGTKGHVTEVDVDHGVKSEADLIGLTIFGAGLVGDFMDTYFGIKPLESWALPDYVRKFFLPSDWPGSKSGLDRS